MWYNSRWWTQSAEQSQKGIPLLLIPIICSRSATICIPLLKKIMVEVGIAEYFGMAEALGIIGTMFVVLYFSRKQMQSLSVDVQTKVLNDLDEKVRKMAEIIIEKPSMQKVIYKLENPSDELAFAYYILFICSNAYAMRQRKVLNDDDRTGWLQWMRNCFKYGTIGEHWKLIQTERWLNPEFENFLNKEVILKPGSSPRNS